MKSIFKKYRIFFAAAFLLALFFCCRTLFPAFQLQHKGSESFNNFISRLFADELTSNTMNLHFTLKDSCLLYTSPSPRDSTLSRMPSSA